MSDPEEIAWALERLADGDYEYVEDEQSGEKEMVIAEAGRFLPELELELMGEIPEEPEVLDQFRASPSPETLQRVLNSLWSLPPELEETLATELSGASYEYCVEAICREVRRLFATSDRMWLRRGERGEVARLGGPIQQVPLGHGFTEVQMIAKQYARDLSWLFPRMIKAAQWLVEDPIAEELPAILSDYLYEASKCFVYGRWLACVIVCRSALEVGFRAFLEREGRGAKKLERMGLGELINLAKSLRRPQLETTLTEASAVNKVACPAVHGRLQALLPVPSYEAAKSTLHRTRGVLRSLLAMAA